MNSFQIYIAVRQVSMHPVPTSTPLKNRYSHPIPSFCYVVEKKRRHILPICHFLCFFFISINLNNSMHFRQSSNNKYLYLLLFQSHCRWDSLFQTCLSFPVFQSRYRMRLSILEVHTDRTGVSWYMHTAGCCSLACPDYQKVVPSQTSTYAAMLEHSWVTCCQLLK